MEANTEAIVRLAWARVLGLPDDALTEPADGRITRPSDELIMFVRLWRHEVLVGPSDFLDRARGSDSDDLVDGSRLLASSSRWRGRLLGQATLAFRDEYLALEELESVCVTDDPAAVLDLEKACPPDDVAEVGLAGMSRALVTLDELDQPTAGAGFVEWETIIGHLGVLTPPAFRRRGFGLIAAALAVNEALDHGLVPQWRSRVENSASRSTAARLGFVEVGSQTTVLLAAPSD
ncbi:MAG TPA: GNAT family N-acetyltransferase [Microlunatus sp.]|nr:GNAT family N-acetyltransferase [Microlunatus sp.]